MFQDEVIKSLDGLESNLLYDTIYNNEEDIIKDIFDNLQENNILTENAIISICAKHNIYLLSSDNEKKDTKETYEIREMLKVINTAYRICKNNFIWQKKIEEKDKNMVEQLNNVKQAINNITDNIAKEQDEFDNEKELLTQNLLEENVITRNVIVKKENSGRLIIKVYTIVCKDEDGSKCPIKKIKKEIEKIFNQKFIAQNQKCGIRLGKDICEYTYIADDKFTIQLGVATAKKEGSIISGDCNTQIRLGDGKYLLAISDGMGSGSDSKRNSKIAITMLERLIGSGFDKEMSIKLINSAIINANKEDMYATLDVVILDLYDARMELLKNGACPTYIKQNKNVYIIRSNSLPTGVINNVNIDVYDKDIKSEDILVICSDGIMESNSEYENKELWIKYLLEDIQTDIPERIADIILKEAIDNNVGKPKDDMSVIVAKITKK